MYFLATTHFVTDRRTDRQQTGDARTVRSAKKERRPHEEDLKAK